MAKMTMNITVALIDPAPPKPVPDAQPRGRSK